jgi:hypothetical protein
LAGQAPTPNKVDVKLSPDGKVKIFNFSGSVDVLADVIGYYTNSTLTEISSRLAALEAANTAQQAQIDALTAKLANVTVEQVGGHPTIRFTGVNAQIVDGTGNTECGEAGFETCNGRGNLVVGYSEDTASGGVESRTGSHNLVTGTDNAYTRYAGLLAGRDNSSLAAYATSPVARPHRSAVARPTPPAATWPWSSVAGPTPRAASRRWRWPARTTRP